GHAARAEALRAGRRPHRASAQLISSAALWLLLSMAISSPRSDNPRPDRFWRWRVLFRPIPTWGSASAPVDLTRASAMRARATAWARPGLRTRAVSTKRFRRSSSNSVHQRSAGSKAPEDSAAKVTGRVNGNTGSAGGDTRQAAVETTRQMVAARNSSVTILMQFSSVAVTRAQTFSVTLPLFQPARLSPCDTKPDYYSLVTCRFVKLHSPGIQCRRRWSRKRSSPLLRCCSSALGQCVFLLSQWTIPSLPRRKRQRWAVECPVPGSVYTSNRL